MLGYAKIWQSISKKQYILGFKVNKIFWITFYTAKHYFSTLSSVILWLFIKNGSHGWTAVISTVNFKWLQEMEFHSSKSALSRLRKFLKIESLLKMTKNAFHHTITTCIMTNISRRKGNQAMTFGQLIQRNMKYVFFEKSYTKCDGDTIPKSFSRKSKLSISLDQHSEVS